MNDYIFFMHDDGDRSRASVGDAWGAYLSKLKAAGVFEGGSAIGSGVCFSQSGATRSIAGHLTGFIQVRAASLEEARALLIGNPVYEAGGTVEIRELPRT
jgi:hypothetical protein